MSLLSAKESKPLQGGPSFSFKHRLFRASWNTVWFILGAWTPAPLHKWRILLLRVFGAQIHKTAHVYGSSRVWYPPNLIMEAGSCLGPKVNCYCMALIHLGRSAIVSQGAYLCAGMHDIEDPEFQLMVRPINIGANAWLAADSFVGPGVTVGECVVLGARSVLFKTVEPHGVYVGNPAQLIRYRSILQKKEI